MQKQKSVFFEVGMMLLVLAVIMGYHSIKNLYAIIPAERYEDKGTFIFSPYQVLPIQVKNTGSVGRNRRMNPTRTVYKVCYKDVDGKGYQWTDEVRNRKAGQNMVDAGFTVERRILSIPDRGTYITIEPDQNAKSYVAGLQKKNMLILGVSAAYILFYLSAWCIIWSRRRRNPTGLFLF